MRALPHVPVSFHLPRITVPKKWATIGYIAAGIALTCLLAFVLPTINAGESDPRMVVETLVVVLFGATISVCEFVHTGNWARFVGVLALTLVISLTARSIPEPEPRVFETGGPAAQLAEK